MEVYDRNTNTVSIQLHMQKEGNVVMGRDEPNRQDVGHMHSYRKDALAECMLHVVNVVVW